MKRVKYLSIIFLLLLFIVLNGCKKEEQNENSKTIISEEIKTLLSENSNYTCKIIGSDDMNVVIYKNQEEYLFENTTEFGSFEHNMPDLFLDNNNLKSYMYYGNNTLKTWGATGGSWTGHGNGLIEIRFTKEEYVDEDGFWLKRLEGMMMPFFALEKIEFNYDSLEKIGSNTYGINGTCFDYYLNWYGLLTFDVECVIVLNNNKITDIKIYIDNVQFEESLYIEEPINLMFHFYDRGNTVVDESGYDNAATFEKRVPDF